MYGGDVDPAAFARLHARVTHSPSPSAAPLTPAHAQRRQQRVRSLASSPGQARVESPLRPEHLAHPKEVDPASPTGSSLSAMQLHHEQRDQQEQEEQQQQEQQEQALSSSLPSTPVILLAHASPSHPPPPAAMPPLSHWQQQPHPAPASDDQVTAASGGSPSHAPLRSSSSSSSVYNTDIHVECVSPSSLRSSGLASSLRSSASGGAGGGGGFSRLRFTGGSYAELSFKAAARPLRDSSTAARQQVLASC